MALLVRPAEDGADLPLTGSGHSVAARPSRPASERLYSGGIGDPVSQVRGCRHWEADVSIDAVCQCTLSSPSLLWTVNLNLNGQRFRLSFTAARAFVKLPQRLRLLAKVPVHGPVVYPGPGDSTQSSGWAFSDRVRVRNRGGGSRRQGRRSVTVSARRIKFGTLTEAGTRRATKWHWSGQVRSGQVRSESPGSGQVYSSYSAEV